MGQSYHCGSVTLLAIADRVTELRNSTVLETKTTPAQIDVWRAAKSEDENLEFKEAKNDFDSEKLFKYCVALANERGGKLLLGIKDKPPREVVGTEAFPNRAKTCLLYTSPSPRDS